MTMVDDAKMADAFAPRAIAERMTSLYRSLRGYDLLSNGTRDELLDLVPAGAASIATLDDDAITDLWARVVTILQRRELEPALTVHGLPYPRYPVGQSEKSYDTPQVRVWDPPYIPDATPKSWNVLGFDVGFPIGIPSCELTANADWIEYYALKGFHILTYRTVRNELRPGSPYDWVFLAGLREPWHSLADAPDGVRHAEGSIPPDLRTISTATSFVAPSPAPEVWKADVRETRRRLDELGGQHLLIVSVTDSVAFDLKSEDSLSESFATVSKAAEEAGAHAIECYLARAGMRSASGLREPCEQSVPTSIAIMRRVRSVLDRRTRLLVKLSADLSDQALADIVVPLARDRVIDGVSGISPVEVEQVTTGPDHDPHPLWTGHKPGVAGYALRHLGQEFVKRLAAIRREAKVDFDIIAMGGVMSPDDVVTLMALGASAVQTATAAVFDPNLAEAAYTTYRASVKSEIWDGYVLRVEPEANIFWARMSLASGSHEDMDAQFGMDEVHPDQRDDVRPGAYLQWTNGWVEEGRRMVRQSALKFLRPPPPNEDDELAGKILAERVADVFGPKPDFG